MDVKVTCPFGGECEEIKDNKIHRCALYQHFKGVDAQGNETDDYACSLSWTPILMIELIRGLSGVQAATESSRNENIKGIGMLAEAIANRSPALPTNVIEVKS